MTEHAVLVGQLWCSAWCDRRGTEIWASAGSNVAWRCAQNRFGLKRILVVVDAHHGNGTQRRSAKWGSLLHASAPVLRGRGYLGWAGEGEGYTINYGGHWRDRQRRRWRRRQALRLTDPVSACTGRSSDLAGHDRDGFRINQRAAVALAKRLWGASSSRWRIQPGGAELRVLATLQSMRGAETWEDPLGAGAGLDGGERWT